MFEIGETYTRDQIHDKVGGNKYSYLPSKNRTVTCICITREMNPDAPHIILCGKGSTVDRAAARLTEQTNALPVFIKESVNHWAYQGQFKVKKCVTGKKKIKKKYRLAGRTDVQLVVEMEESN